MDEDRELPFELNCISFLGKVVAFVGFLLHILTTLSIATGWGWGWGALAFCLPGVAEVYLLFAAASVNPLHWGNAYTFYFFGYIALFVVVGVLYRLLENRYISRMSEKATYIEEPPEVNKKPVDDFSLPG